MFSIFQIPKNTLTEFDKIRMGFMQFFHFPIHIIKKIINVWVWSDKILQALSVIEDDELIIFPR